MHRLGKSNMECKLGSTIRFWGPTSSESTWSFNGKEVTIEYDNKNGFIKRNADFKDSGRYKCKEDCNVTHDFDVIVYDLLKCDLGSTFHLEVNTGSISQTWTVNETEVKSECDPCKGFKKRNADFSDSGRYECRVDGIVKNVFFVIVYDFNIGRITPKHWKTESLGGEEKVSVKTNTTIPPYMKYCIDHTIFKELNQISSVYLVREEENDDHKTTYYYDKIYHEYFDCKIGSEINLKYRTQFVSPTWTLNGNDVISDCNPRDGFKKKKAVLKDSGKYECKENNRVKRIFDVFIYGTYEVKFGSTISLKIDPRCPEESNDSKSSKWTLNGEPVSSECDQQKGFEKENADFTDSGKYKFIVNEKVINVFEVLVYEYLFGDEFLGIRITVPGEAAMKKPEILSTQNQKEKCGSSNLQGTAIDGTGNSAKWRSFVNNISDHFISFFKKGILSKGASKEETKDASEIKTEGASDEETEGYLAQDSQSRSALDKADNTQVSKVSMRRNIQVKVTPTLSPSIMTEKSTGTATSRPCSGITTRNAEAKRNPYKLPEYSMNRNPRGIAVIIAIGKFDTLSQLCGVEKDAESCAKTFKDLHFDVEICKATTEKGVNAFLTYIAEICHEEYDCFMLMFGSHGGNGFICCSDYGFNNKEERGFIDIYSLINTFTSVKSLEGKPKMFFFDSCRQTNEKVVLGRNQSPIRVENDEAALIKKTKHILIGYATVQGTGAIDTTDGGLYTQQLTTALDKLGKIESILDVLTIVGHNMDEKLKELNTIPGYTLAQTPSIHFTLNKKLTMKDLNRYDCHLFRYLIFTVAALVFGFIVLELCPF